MVDPLFIDLYPRDHQLDAPAYIAAGLPWAGAIFKLTEGVSYDYAVWAMKQRQPFIEHERYGTTLFDGFYHYLRLDQDPTAQAERFWAAMERIGGERAGTLWAMVDVERGGQGDVTLSPELVKGATRAWAARYEQLSGRRATLYGGELLRASDVTDLLSCGRSAVALYSAELHGRGESTADFLRRTGTDLAHTLLWQYCAGEGAATGPAGYPTEAPGIGRCDINALILPGGLAAVREGLRPGAPSATH